eukprot:s3980_g2.t1
MAPWSDGSGCNFVRRMRKCLQCMERQLYESVFVTTNEDSGRSSWRTWARLWDGGPSLSACSMRTKPRFRLRTFRGNFLYGDPGVLRNSTCGKDFASYVTDNFDVSAPMVPIPDDHGSRMEPPGCEEKPYEATPLFADGHAEEDIVQCGLHDVPAEAGCLEARDVPQLTLREQQQPSGRTAPTPAIASHTGCFGWLTDCFIDMFGWTATPALKATRGHLRVCPLPPNLEKEPGNITSDDDDESGKAELAETDVGSAARSLGCRSVKPRDRTQGPDQKTRQRAKKNRDGRLCRDRGLEPAISNEMGCTLDGSSATCRSQCECLRDRTPEPRVKTRGRASIARDRTQGPETKTRERAKSQFGHSKATGPVCGPPRVHRPRRAMGSWRGGQSYVKKGGLAGRHGGLHALVQDLCRSERAIGKIAQGDFEHGQPGYAGTHGHDEQVLRHIVREECRRILQPGARIDEDRTAPACFHEDAHVLSMSCRTSHVASHEGSPAWWRAGGPDLLASLKPLITQLVREAIQEALKDLLPNPGQQAHRTVTDGPEKARRKGKGNASSEGRPAETAQPNKPQPAVEKGKGKDRKPCGHDTDKTEGRGGKQRKGKGKDGKGSSDAAAEGGWITVQRRKPDADAQAFTLEARDWEAPVRDVTELAKLFDTLPAGEVLNGVMLVTSAQAAVARTMATGSKAKYSLTLVELCKKGADTVPGTISGQRRFAMGTIHKVHSDGAQAPRVVCKAKAVEIAKKSTTVMFVRIPRIFAKKVWPDFKRSPNRQAMAWAARYGLRFVDTFGWKEQKTAQGIEQLYGMARVEVEAVKDVLRVSGTEGVFLEPHRQQLATRVTWEQPDKNEAHEAYLERMFKGKGDLGLATCGHTLGYRYELLTGDRVKRAWVLRDAPLHFGFLEAAEALQTAFKDVTITSCKRVRQAKSFFFKATADAAANRDALPVPIIYDGSEMTLWAVWSLPRHGQLQQRTVRPDSVPALETPKLQVTAHTTEPQVVVEADGKETPAPKKQKLPESKRTYPSSLVLREQPRDGNCVFHTLCAGVAWLTANSKTKVALTAREMRARIVEHLRKHATAYEKDFDGKGPCGTTMDFASYLEAVSQDGAYGSQIEVKAFCRMFDTRCIVVPEFSCFPCESFHNQAPSRVLVLYLTGSPCSHMDLLLPEGALESGAGPKSCVYPKEILDIRSPPSVPYRVGGRTGASTSSSSVAGAVWSRPTSRSTATRGTVWTHCTRGTQGEAAAAVPNKGAQAPSARSGGTVFTALPGSKAKVSRAADSHKHAAREDDELSQDLENCEEPIPKPKRKTPQKRWPTPADLIFRCALCPFMKQTKDVQHYENCRNKHCDRAHGGQGRPGRRVRPKTVKVTRAGRRARLFAWICPYCPQGITWAQRQEIPAQTCVNIKKDHYLLCHQDVPYDRWLADIRPKQQGIKDLPAHQANVRQIVLKRHALRELQAPKFPGMTPFLWPDFHRRNPKPGKPRKPKPKTAGSTRVSLVRVWRCDQCGFFSRHKKVAKAHQAPSCTASTWRSETSTARLTKLAEIATWVQDAELQDEDRGLVLQAVAAAQKIVEQTLPLQPSSDF